MVSASPLIIHHVAQHIRFCDETDHSIPFDDGKTTDFFVHHQSSRVFDAGVRRNSNDFFGHDFLDPDGLDEGARNLAAEPQCGN
jgi:hypothetical protein